MSWKQKTVEYEGLKALWNSDDLGSWLLAKGHYWDIRAVRRNKCLECKLSDSTYVRKRIKNDFRDFLVNEYIPWKYARNWQKAKQDTVNLWGDDKIKSVSKSLLAYYRCIQKTEEMTAELFREGFELLENVFQRDKTGIAIVGISGLLSLTAPDRFGTVDRFVAGALEELGELECGRKNCSDIGIAEAVQMEIVMWNKAKAMKEQLKKVDWRPRDIDMVLWSYGRDLQKRAK